MDDVPLGAYLARWLEVQRSQIQPTTWHSYKGNVDRYIDPTLGEVPVGQLTVPQLNAFYARLLRQGGKHGKPLSVRTVRYVHEVLHKALADAVRTGELDRNVTDHATLPRHRPDGDDPDDAKRRAWTAEELRAFLELARPDPLYPVWALAATTGMRRGELLGLRWCDLDLDGATLHVRRSLAQTPDGLRLKSPKTARARSLRVDRFTVGLLRARQVAQRRDRDAAGEGWCDRWDLVFTDAQGAPLDPMKVTFAFRAMVRRLPLPVLRLHDLRHTHATLLLEAGVPALTVSRRLGHGSIRITLDVYGHVLPAMDADAVERFTDHVFGGDGDGDDWPADAEAS